MASRGVESVAVPIDGGAEGCRSCLVDNSRVQEHGG